MFIVYAFSTLFLRVKFVNVLLSADTDVAGAADISATGWGRDDAADCGTNTETTRYSHCPHGCHAVAVSMLCTYSPY